MNEIFKGDTLKFGYVCEYDDGLIYTFQPNDVVYIIVKNINNQIVHNSKITVKETCKTVEVNIDTSNFSIGMNSLELKLLTKNEIFTTREEILVKESEMIEWIYLKVKWVILMGIVLIK